MAASSVFNQRFEAQKDDYIQSRLKELSPNRFYIGINSSCIWGKENPVEEKRHLEEVCRGAESKFSSSQQKTSHYKRGWQLRRKAFNQRQLALTDRKGSAKAERITPVSKVRRSWQSIQSDRSQLWSEPSTSYDASRRSSTTGHVQGKQEVSGSRKTLSLRI